MTDEKEKDVQANKKERDLDEIYKRIEEQEKKEDALLEYIKSRDAEQDSQQNDKPKKTGFIKKASKKTVNFADNATTGMDGSAFSLIRWVISFIGEVVVAIREYAESYVLGSSNKGVDDDYEEDDR